VGGDTAEGAYEKKHRWCKNDEHETYEQTGKNKKKTGPQRGGGTDQGRIGRGYVEKDQGSIWGRGRSINDLTFWACGPEIFLSDQKGEKGKENTVLGDVSTVES